MHFFKENFCTYPKTSDIRHTLVGNTIVDYSDVVYIFILDLTSGFKGFSKDSRKTVQESLKGWDLVRLILETWRYIKISLTFVCRVQPWSRWLGDGQVTNRPLPEPMMTWITDMCHQGLFLYWHGLTLITAWISNSNHFKMWEWITYPFLNFNDAAVEVCELIR